MYKKIIFDKVDGSLERFNQALKTIDCDSRFRYRTREKLLTVTVASDIVRGKNY